MQMDLIGALIYLAGSVVCHQLPERSFFLDGQQLPVCARCTGLYAGGLAGLAAWFAIKLARGWRRMVVPPRVALAVVAITAAPTALSLLTAALGVWDGSNVTRALLAIPPGLAAGVVVAAVATKDLR
jgi:uncharacterized membrane protein